jgi:hypothetical protein
MIELTRRSLLSAASVLIAAPAIVKASSLMRIAVPRRTVIYVRNTAIELSEAYQFMVAGQGKTEISFDGKTWFERSPIEVREGDKVFYSFTGPALPDPRDFDVAEIAPVR